jgi:hypothetical protein
VRDSVKQVELFKHGFEAHGRRGTSQLMPVVNGGHVQRYPPLGRLVHIPVRHGFDVQPRDIVSQREPKPDRERKRPLPLVD